MADLAGAEAVAAWRVAEALGHRAAPNGPVRGMTPTRPWSLGLALRAQALNRDLQRAARAGGGPEALR